MAGSSRQHRGKKRRKELARKERQEEKRQRRAEKKVDGAGTGPPIDWTASEGSPPVEDTSRPEETSDLPPEMKPA